MMHWFENWFDSKYYHTLYNNRDENEAKLFIDNIINFLQIKDAINIIDIACGKGRHAKYLNSLGHKVVGIDLSKKSINHAKSLSKEDLKFAVHDMRKTFKEKGFDLALNLFTSFGYFKNESDDKNTIVAMNQNLKNHGILVIDFMNVNKVIRNIVKEECKIINGITFKINREILKNRIVKNILVLDKGNKYHFKESVRLLDHSLLSTLLKENGFTILKEFGNYKLDDYSSKDSDRLIFIAKK